MSSGFPGGVLRAPIQANHTGDIVAAVSGKRIRVLAIWLVAAGTVNVKLASGSVSPVRDLCGTIPMGANGQFVLPLNELGWFDTDVGGGLLADLSAAIAVGGAVVYTLV